MTRKITFPKHFVKYCVKRLYILYIIYTHKEVLTAFGKSKIIFGDQTLLKPKGRRRTQIVLKYKYLLQCLQHGPITIW